MGMMTALFFMCGFLATLNDILVPHLKAIFELNYAEVMLIQFSFFSSFLIFGFPSGKLVEHIGYKRTLVVGLCTMSVGALMFIPAATTPSFVMFMAALLVLAGGITAIQVSGNCYVSKLGAARTASSRLNLTQAFNSLGSTIAPYFGGVLILGAAATTVQPHIANMQASLLHAYRVQQASYVIRPYIGIAVALFALAGIVALSRLPALHDAGGQNCATDNLPGLWSYRHFVFGIAAVFLYCGAEIAIGSFLVNYLIQPGIGGMTAARASAYVSIYWGGSMLGRFAGSALLRTVKTRTLLSVNAVAALSLVTVSILSHGRLAMWAILLVGTFNSIMFPSLFTLGIAELGVLSSKASGVLMSAAVGAAIIPVMQGAIADRIGIQYSFILPAFCYTYVIFYGAIGCRPKIFSTDH